MFVGGRVRVEGGQALLERGQGRLVVPVDRLHVRELDVRGRLGEARTGLAQHRVGAIETELEVAAEDRVPGRGAEHGRPQLGVDALEPGKRALGPDAHFECTTGVRLEASAATIRSARSLSSASSRSKLHATALRRLSSSIIESQLPGELVGAEEPGTDLFGKVTKCAACRRRHTSGSSESSSRSRAY